MLLAAIARASAYATAFVATNAPGWRKRPRSSATTAASATPFSDTVPPPNSSGTNIANHPSSAAWRRYSAPGPVRSSASSRTLVSGHADSMKRAVVSRINS